MQIMYRKEPIPVFCGDPNLALMLLPWDDIVKLWSLKDAICYYHLAVQGDTGGRPMVYSLGLVQAGLRSVSFP